MQFETKSKSTSELETVVKENVVCKSIVKEQKSGIKNKIDQMKEDLEELKQLESK